MSEKRFVTVETDEGVKYYGRLLGLINDAEFHHTINNRKIQNKTFSVETKLLKDIAEGYEDLNGLRLVVALRKIDGQEICEKLLFISEKLEMISCIVTDKEIYITGQNDEFLTVTEEVE